jgi:Ca2+/H+ antiporter
VSSNLDLLFPVLAPKDESDGEKITVLVNNDEEISMNWTIMMFGVYLAFLGFFLMSHTAKAVKESLEDYDVETGKKESSEKETWCEKISGYILHTSTSFSFICSGGQCYNIGTGFLGNLWIVSTILKPLSFILVLYSLYTIWKKQ